MRIILSILIFFSYTLSYAQCCCSHLGLNFIDTTNTEITSTIQFEDIYPNLMDKLKIEPQFPREEFNKRNESKSYINISTACGIDSLILKMTHRNTQMELKLFSIPGDQPILLSDIKFREGSYSLNVAESLKTNRLNGCCEIRATKKSDASLAYFCKSYPIRSKIKQCHTVFKPAN